jgi:PAS domain S-box-containing protein
MKKKSVKTHKNNAGSQDNVNRHEQTEEKLHHEEQRFRALVEYSSDIIVVVNLEGIITYINPSVERVLGFKAEERIGANVFELVHPDDMKFKFLADSFNILARDTNAPVIQGEIHLRHKDGSWRTFEAVGSNLVNNNVVEAIIVNYRDITERKQFEEALRKSENKYRIIAENTADPIAILDMNLHFTYVSPNIMRLNGLTIDEAMSQTLEQVLTPESMRLVMTVFEEEMQLEASGKADPDRTRILEVEEYKKDGSTIWVGVSFSFLRDNDRKPVEIIMVSRDITERRKMEEALRQNEERWGKIKKSVKRIKAV